MDAMSLEIGRIYRDMNDNPYQIKAIAYHSETMEKMVVYQALYGDFLYYVSSCEKFIREICQKESGKLPDPVELFEEPEKIEEPDDADDTDEQADPFLIKFLDAENFQEKLNILAYLKPSLDDRMIDTMAASMEVEVPKGSLDERYESLCSCIRTRAKYECTRPR